MRFVSFLRPCGTPSWGRLDGETILDLGAVPGAPVDLKAALAAGLPHAPTDGPALARIDVTLLPVIPNPDKILCIGLNYATHVAETGREQKEHPAIFHRWADTLAADGAPFIHPAETKRFDYEGELAVVIGKAGRRIAPEAAFDHIAGFAPFNDGSIRDWQRHNSQFTPGKNWPATGGFGPALVTPDEIPDLGSQRVQTRVNGTLVQDQPVSDMIWDIPTLIAYCSTFTQLNPGDVISTGTPGGVGDKRNPPLYLQPGDTVEIAIGTIGTLTNPVIAEA
ncbi:fumarylacetoacetate (FAA) hydrolase [Novosphingobium nitrogenifigens DSM 19370]|uniref:Fumarylacetoacetate (FAA) hydrolase n=1 Tax=Novosphingobium nitrogenifigens DSM 19370 TaxID=983920 RepID=F1Z6D4_9SPHN|nr:fumarylacetoacetate hydrolase family protein [Novosphingobium nitrogenifigens]EGD59916.1 fumarylacetoacetate (FAA) hydrolase [Novosphingobium nitrogenifigens DSM 19370]